MGREYLEGLSVDGMKKILQNKAVRSRLSHVYVVAMATRCACALLAELYQQ
jgi:hypothetical protein